MSSGPIETSVSATDVRLAGDILRVVHGGLPDLNTSNPQAALEELRQNHQGFRSFLNQPPHGNAMVNSCLLYPPAAPDTDGTLFLASRFAYAPLAGTALMAAAAALARQALEDGQAARNAYFFQTANGPARINVQNAAGLTAQAEWITAPPAMLSANAELPGAPGRTHSVSLVSTGLPYLVADEDTLGASLDDHPSLGPAAAALSRRASEVFPTSRFGAEASYAPYLVMAIRQTARDHIRTVWISDAGEIASSAGGTGALAVVEACQARGLVQPDTRVTVEAPGGAFDCRVGSSQASVQAETRITASHLFYWPGESGTVK
ncbi:hypothetical protein RA19_03275 [Leisingera sp. ANG-M1]|uniref:proline racemase family protein n=1 Tax=Leisingera sp. ANG-M1 TaxID=1577895 RepID=UPI00057D127B|nr:proline racemase family protein [Leisingera sp. ANG-M1]KIC12276.1 hypothetical protein RA19_03275 [Leisingera sp. ANG-M1]